MKTKQKRKNKTYTYLCRILYSFVYFMKIEKRMFHNVPHTDTHTHADADNIQNFKSMNEIVIL